MNRNPVVFAMKIGYIGVPTTFFSVLPSPGELRVLLADEQEHVRAQQPHEDGGDQQHVDRVEARDHRGSRERAAEEERREVRADQGDRQGDRVGDADAGARDEVVGQRVAQETLEDRQDQHQQPDGPVELAGLAERAGEEHPGHVDHDRADEDVAGPVVHLAHQQAAANREREVHRRVERLGQDLAAQRPVRAVVDDRGRGGHVVQGEEDAGGQQDHEGVQGDLAQHERPVVGEDLVEEGPAALDDPEPLVELADGLADASVGAERRLGGAHRALERTHVLRSQKPGPVGWSKPDWARKNPSASMYRGSWGSGRGAGPNVGSAWSSTKNIDW